MRGVISMEVKKIIIASVVSVSLLGGVGSGVASANLADQVDQNDRETYGAYDAHGAVQTSSQTKFDTDRGYNVMWDTQFNIPNTVSIKTMEMTVMLPKSLSTTASDVSLLQGGSAGKLNQGSDYTVSVKGQVVTLVVKNPARFFAIGTQSNRLLFRVNTAVNLETVSKSVGIRASNTINKGRSDELIMRPSNPTVVRITPFQIQPISIKNSAAQLLKSVTGDSNYSNRVANAQADFAKSGNTIRQ